MSDWENIKLGSVANIRSGFAFKSKDMGNSGYPIVKIKNISPPTVDVYDVQRVPHEVIEGNERVSYFKLAAGDILIAMTGATVGKVGRMPATIEPYFLNQRVGKVYLKQPERADYNFLYYVLSQEAYVKQMVGIADGSAQANISGKQIESLPILLPPFIEQRAIAHILGSFDDKIELNRRMNETLEAMAHAIFKSWFVDFDPVHAKAEGRDTGLPEEIAALFPDSFEVSDIGGIPISWKISTVGAEFNLMMGQSPPGETYNEKGNGLPFFQGRRDFGFRYPTNRVYCTAPKRLADHGDTLVSVRAPVGEINMAMERCCIGRGVAGIRHNTGCRSYTYYGMHTLKDWFARYEAEGTVFGAINKTQFERLRWLSLPSEVIKKFEEYVFPIDEHIETNIREMDSLGSLRDTLLPKLISGELRVPDVEKFIEETGL